MIILCLFLVQGCAYITYESDGKTEELKVFTLWKSLDGLWAERDGEDFSLVIDKTYTHDPLRAIGELMDNYQQMYDMGLRFEPNDRPTPLVPIGE
jgi:hypothetical protein